MTSLQLYKRRLPLLFCLLACVALSQNRSTNIQTFEGRKYYIHKIEKSQSVYAISKLYNVTIDDIYLVNPGLKNGAKANQEIKVPLAPAITSTVAPLAIDTSKFVTYKAQKGETVYAVLRKFNLTEKQLLAFNPSLTQGLKEGQTIVVGEKKRKTTPAKETRPVVKEPKLPATDSIVIQPLPLSRPKKTSYNVALMLPFRLEKTLEIETATLAKSNAAFPAVPSLAVDFYLGFKKALDSVLDKDFDIHFDLYDVDDKDSLKLTQIINSPRFKDLDFIFGPLYANDFKTISKKAKDVSTPIVSPITQQNKILFNNAYISKTNPSQFTLQESLADYCIDSLMTSNANLILMSSGFDRKENNYVAEFRKYFNDKIRALGRPLSDTVKPAKGMPGVNLVYVPNVRNIVVSLSNNQVFIADFTTQLALFAHEKDIVLCGWENVSGMDNIDQEYLNQLHYTFPHQFNILNTRAYERIIAQYKQQLETYPSEYFFIGFDVAYFYLKNLKETGPEFVHHLDTLTTETNYMRFKFARPDAATGFDNRGVYIFRYNNYHLEKTGWK